MSILIEEIDPLAALALVEAGLAIMLDVREQDEWEAGHAGPATHIPLGQLSLENIRPGPVVVVCRSGIRSSRVTRALVEAGLDAKNVAGGMHAWVESGLGIVRDDGQVATII